MKKLSYLTIFAFIVLAGCGLWKATSPIQYSGDIIFSHKMHMEMEIECEMCHTEVAENKLASQSNYPKEESCIECHKREECSLCHINAENATPLKQSPVNYIFSHATHLENTESETPCLTCHEQITESTKADEKYPVGIKTCRSCHEITADNCIMCHYSLGDANFVPASHDNSWLERHRQAGFDDGEKFCANCHRGQIRPSGDETLSVADDHFVEEAKTCAECHRGDLQSENVHDSNYLLSHGIDATSNQNVCDGCHQRDECVACHDKRDVSPVDYHPAGWHFEHADNARRQEPNCTGCHREEDCLECHRVVPPHPSDWNSRHRRVAEGSETVCSKCHEKSFCSACHDQ